MVLIDLNLYESQIGAKDRQGWKQIRRLSSEALQQPHTVTVYRCTIGEDASYNYHRNVLCPWKRRKFSDWGGK